MRLLGKLAMGASLLLTSCVSAADTFPINQQARDIGQVQIHFRRTGSSGPVTVKMPDGEVLKGEYHVANQGGVAMAFAGGETATGIAEGGGNVQFVAYGPKTELLCQGWSSAFGHGSGRCQTEDGAVWAVDW